MIGLARSSRHERGDDPLVLQHALAPPDFEYHVERCLDVIERRVQRGACHRADQRIGRERRDPAMELEHEPARYTVVLIEPAPVRIDGAQLREVCRAHGLRTAPKYAATERVPCTLRLDTVRGRLGPGFGDQLGTRRARDASNVSRSQTRSWPPRSSGVKGSRVQILSSRRLFALVRVVIFKITALTVPALCQIGKIMPAAAGGRCALVAPGVSVCAVSVAAARNGSQRAAQPAPRGSQPSTRRPAGRPANRDVVRDGQRYSASGRCSRSSPTARSCRRTSSRSHL